MDALRREQARLRSLTEGIPGELEQVLYQEAWRVLGKSIKIAPIDTGRLRASARVDLPERSGSDVSVRLSYNTDYAKYVHDKTAGGHPVNYRAPGTQSMFLSGPLEENITEMTERIQKRLERMVKIRVGE